MIRWLVAIVAVLVVGARSLAEAGALAAALLIGWFIFVLLRPHRTCSWCGGTRRAKRWRWFGKVGRCHRCKARAVHKRLGAVMVHRMFWAVIGERWMDRRHAAMQEREKELNPDATPGLPRTLPR